MSLSCGIGDKNGEPLPWFTYPFAADLYRRPGVDTVDQNHYGIAASH